MRGNLSATFVPPPALFVEVFFPTAGDTAGDVGLFAEGGNTTLPLVLALFIAEHSLGS